MQSIYFYEYALGLAEQERARQRRHAQQLREAGITGHPPRAWLAIVAALLAFFRFG